MITQNQYESWRFSCSIRCKYAKTYTIMGRTNLEWRSDRLLTHLLSNSPDAIAISHNNNNFTAANRGKLYDVFSLTSKSD